MHTQDYIREFITIFFIRRKSIVAVIVACLIVSIAVSFLWPASYRAESTLIIKGSRTLESERTIGDVQTNVEPLSEEDLYSEREIIGSRSVVEGALERLSDVEGAEIAGRVRSNLSAEIVPESNVIEASLVWHDPEMAERLLAAVLDEYREQRQDIFNPQDARAFFSSQVESARMRLDNLEERLLETTGGASVEDLEGKLTANRELQTELRRELNRLKNDRSGRSEYIAYLQRRLAAPEQQFFTGLRNESLGDIAERIMEVIIERESQLQHYEPGSPPMQRRQAQIDRLYERFRGEVAGIVSDERQQLNTIDATIADISERLSTLQSEEDERYRDLLDARRLSRERSIMEDSYTAFARRFREATIQNETGSDSLFSVSQVQPAVAGTAPVFPQPSRLIPLGLLLGVLLGITFGFVAEFFDHRVKRPEDIESYTDLNYVFSVPEK